MYKLALLLLMLLVLPLQAAVLWSQAPTGTNASAYIDQEFPDFPAFSTYQVADVTVGAGGWAIDSITSYFGSGGGSWPSSLDVRVNIFSKTGALPLASDDPTAGAEYAATLTADGSFLDVTASGLGIHLAPGAYWIGMTPIVDFATYGQNFHWQTSGIVGDPSALRNPGNGFADGSDWGTYAMIGGTAGDGAILIEGTGATPEPAAYLLVAGGLGLLGLLRRRL